MLMSNDIALFGEGIDGLRLGGLGCRGGCGCKKCNGISGLGYGSSWDQWYCQGFLAPEVFAACVPPTPQEVLRSDESMFGGQLSRESRERATGMAEEIVRNDPSLQPTGGNINWWLVGGIGLATIVLLKRI